MSLHLYAHTHTHTHTHTRIRRTHSHTLKHTHKETQRFNTSDKHTHTRSLSHTHSLFLLLDKDNRSTVDYTEFEIMMAELMVKISRIDGFADSGWNRIDICIIVCRLAVLPLLWLSNDHGVFVNKFERLLSLPVHCVYWAKILLRHVIC